MLIQNKTIDDVLFLKYVTYVKTKRLYKNNSHLLSSLNTITNALRSQINNETHTLGDVEFNAELDSAVDDLCH